MFYAQDKLHKNLQVNLLVVNVSPCHLFDLKNSSNLQNFFVHFCAVG